MEELQQFNFEDSGVRVIEKESEPWFVGKDVANILGYSQQAKAIREHVPDKYKGVSVLDTPGGKQEMTIISEAGLYKLIFKSHAPNAEKFSDWVASEVLPTIRKHGAYMTNEKIEEVLTNPDTIIKLATQLKQERENRLVLEQRVNELQPKASYYDKVLHCKNLLPITTIAKDYGMSGTKLDKLLHELKVIYKLSGTWVLYAKYQSKGWTQSATHTIKLSDGTYKTVLNTKWTQKGRLGLYELLKEHGILPQIEREDVEEKVAED